MPSGFTQVSSANLTDASGSPLTNASISFTPCSNFGSPLSFRVNGSGQAMSATITVPVVNGAFSVSLADTTLTNPQNICYLVEVKKFNGKNLLGPGYLIQPSGSTWSFDTFSPTIPNLGIIQTGPQGPPGEDGVLTGNYDGPLTLSSVTVSDFTDTPIGTDIQGNTAFAFTDSMGHGALVIREDGTALFGSDLSVSGTLMAAAVSIVDINSSDVTTQALQIADVVDSPLGSSFIPAVDGLMDGTGKLLYAGLADGSFYGCENARVDVYQQSCQDGDGNAYYSYPVVSTPYPLYQIFVKVKATGQVLQLTTQGNNLRPALSADGKFISFISDRSGTMQPYQMSIAAAYGVIASGQDFNSQSTLDHVHVTGQSLASGHLGTPPLSTTQPYSNITFVGGPRFEYSTGIVLTSSSPQLASFVPLVESFNDGNNPALSSSTDGETILSGCCNKLFIDALNNDNVARQFLATASSWGGNDYAHIKKGQPVYSNSLTIFSAAKTLATAASKTYRVAAIAVEHGEQDSAEGTTIYAADLAQWQQDYEGDIKAITGQTTGVPMFFSQVSQPAQSGQTKELIAVQQLNAFIANPGRLYLTGPKYMYPYADQQHLTNVGYRWEGEYMAKAIRQVVYENKRWKPLYPLSAVIYGNQIFIKFYVPVGPLVLDTTIVSEPTYVTGGMKGFEFYDNSGSTPAITAVDIIGADTVRLTLASAPTGTTRQVAYAYTASSATVGGGPTTGPRGNLRDSDNSPSLNGNTLYNWCVHFNLNI